MRERIFNLLNGTPFRVVIFHEVSFIQAYKMLNDLRMRAPKFTVQAKGAVDLCR